MNSNSNSLIRMSSRSDSVIELLNGKFIDVINGKYFNDKSIIIKKGRILSIGEDEKKSKNITIDGKIDLHGKTVMPALFNTHCHIQLTLPSLLTNLKDINLMKKFCEAQVVKRMADCLACGITNIRDAWTEDLTMNRKLKERIGKGEIPGPRIYQSVLVSPTGGSFASKRGMKEKIMFSFGDMPYVEIEKPESGVVAFDPEGKNAVIRDAIDRAIEERGAEYIKVYDQREKRFSYKPGATIMTYNQLRVLVDHSLRRGLKTTMHHLTVESFKRGVGAGISSLAHIPYDAVLDESDMLLFENSHCFLEPTMTLAYYLCWNIKGDQWNNHPEMERLSAFRKSTYKNLIDDFWIPEMRQSAKSGIEKAETEKFTIFGLMDMSIIFKYYSGIITNGAKNLRMLYDHGKRIGCGNDAGAIPCSDAMVNHELEMLNFCLKENGIGNTLNGVEALKMATINSAGALGLEDKFGSINTGKIADLAIINGDPFSDFRLIGSPVEALFMDGVLVINNCNLKIVG